MENPLTNEIKKTLAILRTRWPEAVLIIGLGFVPNLLNHILRIHSNLRMLVSFVGIGIFLLVTIISAGFLRTLYLEQDKRQSLHSLMQIGKHFLWRLLGFSILCGLAVMLFVWLLHTIIANTLSNATFPFANQIGFTFITLIFAKLVLLIPAIIIVLDCRLSESFGLMWKVNLLKAKPLLMIFLIQMIVLPYLLLFFPNFRAAQPAITWSYTGFMLYSIILRILGLMVQVMAIRFVASLGIDYTNLISRQSFSS